MDFLKNINKEFYLNSKFNFIKDEYHYLFKSEDSLNIGRVKVKVSDLNTQQIFLHITEIENIDTLVDDTAKLMCNNLQRDAETFKKITNKVIKAWDETPKKFIHQIDREDTFKYKDLLTDEEYLLSVFVFLGKISYHSVFSFTTGYGGDTFYKKDFYVKCLEDIDEWVLKTCREINSSKVKTRIKNQIFKTEIYFSIQKINDLLTLSENKKVKQKNKPKFPINFTGDEMNDLMNELEGDYVDEDLIEFMQDEHGLDISSLLDWEISYEYEGFHHNDGQICDYTVTFTSPEGYNYYAYNSHSLITGWNFYEDVKIK